MKDLSEKEIYEDDQQRWGEELATEERDFRWNHLFEIYRAFSLISVSDISISDVLMEMGLSRLEIYGYGEIAHIFLGFIDERIEVSDVFDSNLAGQKTDSGSIIKEPSRISNNEIPLVITPGRHIRQIVFSLMGKGVERRKLLSVYTILDYCMEKINRGKDWEVPCFWTKKFLIVSSGFHNKGSQSMLFSTMDGIRKKWKDAEIFFLPEDDPAAYPVELQKRYKLHFLLYPRYLGSPLYDFFTVVDCVINIGGYELGSRLPWDWNEQFFYYSNIAINYNIPLYRLPQSYGPFDFPESVNRQIKRDLQYAEKIYVREKAYMETMKEKYELTELIYSADIVLQNKESDIDNIFESYNKRCFNLEDNSTELAAVIPNERCYDYGDSKQLLDMYKQVVDLLMKNDLTVYILSHSDDTKICRDIYEMFPGENRVRLFAENLDCLEFSDLIEKFCFVIASRYHSVVHAYKKNVPAVIIGWAEKYKELAELFGQESYCFDVREGISLNGILGSVRKMIKDHKAEKECIEKHMAVIRRHNLFDDISLP